ncbi:GNAT family N-acetyltransferase [Nocardia sp. NPDC004582]
MNDPNAYEIAVDTGRIDIDRVHHWLSTDAYWALGRERDIVERAIRGSINIGAYDRHGDQVAYARIVTDLATFAWLCDVYVSRDHRATGLGRALVTTARDHLAPYKLKRMILATHDAHGLYSQLGFTRLPNPEHWMVLAAEG